MAAALRRTAFFSKMVGPRTTAASPTMVTASLRQEEAAGKKAGPQGNGFRRGLGLLAAAMAGVVTTAAGIAYADEAEHILHPAALPRGCMDSYDHASLRQGRQIYQQSCSDCHTGVF